MGGAWAHRAPLTPSQTLFVSRQPVWQPVLGALRGRGAAAVPRVEGGLLLALLLALPLLLALLLALPMAPLPPPLPLRTLSLLHGPVGPCVPPWD